MLYLGVMLKCENVGFGYGAAGTEVLREVTLQLQAGRVTVILGCNGSGKSTLLKLMLGLLTPWSGRVEMGGRVVGEIGARERAVRLAYVPQSVAVSEPLSARRVVGLARFAQGMAGARDEEAIESAMRRAECAELAERSFATLSAGQQQRVTLARALAQLGTSTQYAATAILADEPISAMDPRHALHAMGVLREEARQGRAVAVVLHDLTLAAHFADVAVLLSPEGRVLGAGNVDEVMTPELLERAFGVGFRVIREGGRVAAIVPEIMRVSALIKPSG